MNEEKLIMDLDILTVEEVQIIQHTWSKVGHTIDLTIDFYNRLFDLYPRLRPLFKEDIRLQARKFTAHMTYVVSHLNNWKRLQSDLHELGKRHVSYEVKPEYFEYVREALFHVIRDRMQESWDANTEQAWGRFYKLITHSMIKTMQTNLE